MLDNHQLARKVGQAISVYLGAVCFLYAWIGVALLVAPNKSTAVQENGILINPRVWGTIFLFVAACLLLTLWNSHRRSFRRFAMGALVGVTALWTTSLTLLIMLTGLNPSSSVVWAFLLLCHLIAASFSGDSPELFDLGPLKALTHQRWLLWLLWLWPDTRKRTPTAPPTAPPPVGGTS